MERQLRRGPSFSSSWNRNSAFGSSRGFVNEPVTWRKTPTASSFCPRRSATDRESCWFFSFSASEPKRARAACPRSQSIAACPRNVFGCTLKKALLSLMVTAWRIADARRSTWKSSASVMPSACTCIRMQSGETGGTSSCWVSALLLTGAGVSAKSSAPPCSLSSRQPSTSTSSSPPLSSSSSSPSSTAAREFAATWRDCAAAAACSVSTRCFSAARSLSASAALFAAAAACACAAAWRFLSSSSFFLRSASSRFFFSWRRMAWTMREYFMRVIERRHVDCSSRIFSCRNRASRLRESSARARNVRAVACRTMARPPRSRARSFSMLSTTSRLRRIIVDPRRNFLGSIFMCFIIARHALFGSCVAATAWGQMHVKVPMKSWCAKREGYDSRDIRTASITPPHLSCSTAFWSWKHSAFFSALGFTHRTKCGSAALIASIRDDRSVLKVAETDLYATLPPPPPLRPGLIGVAPGRSWAASNRPTKNLDLEVSISAITSATSESLFFSQKSSMSYETLPA
mmetsp:Transcript_42106/g.99941  ORF Transcript_42106/g.99941 Transcript_42106/m.99941 type:complete len:517 (+) Transcript_42106:1422-2972(+)